MISKKIDRNNRLDYAFLLSVLGKVGSAVTGILVVVILTRIFSIVEMSLYFLFFQAIRFLNVVGAFGLPNVTQKYLGIYEAEGDHAKIGCFFNRILYIYLSATIVLFCFFQFYWHAINGLFYNDALSRGVSIALFFVGAFRALELIESAYFRARREYLHGILLLGFPRDLIILIVLFVIYIVQFEVDLTMVIFLYFMVSLIIVFIVSRLIYIRSANYHDVIGADTLSSAPIGTKAILAVMAPMYIHSVASVLYTTSDLWILGVYASENEIANYGAAIRLISLLLFLLSVVNFIIPSVIARLFSTEKIKDVEKVARGSAFFVVMFAFPAVIVYWLFGESLMVFVFGDEYAIGAAYLEIISIGAFVSAFVGSPGVVLQMTGHHTALTRITLVTLLFNLTVNFLVVEKYGAIGVAYVTSMSLIVQNLVMSVFVYKVLNIKTYTFFSIKLIRESISLARQRV